MSDDLIERLRAHQCGCGGACGQQTPAFIAEAADALAAKDTAISEMRAELERATALAELRQRMLDEALFELEAYRARALASIQDEPDTDLGARG